MRLVLVAPGTLQLDVEAVREQSRQLQGELGGPAFVALQQGLADRAGLRARQQDEALGQLLQPLQPGDGLRPHDVARPGAGQDFAEVEVAAVILDQQDDARQARRVAAQALQHQLAADHGLQAAPRASL